MNRKTILKKLSEYLDPVSIGTLEISTYAFPGGVSICLSVADIMRNFNDTQETEDKVCELLSAFLKIHFNSTEK